MKKRQIVVLAKNNSNNQTKQVVVKSASEEKQVDDALINACNSFIYFLNDETLKLSTTADDAFASIDNTTIATMREILEVSFVQSIRAASEVGDFVLIRKIIHAAVDYAYAFVQYIKRMDAAFVNNIHPVALLRPRIFGEALSSLEKTKASVSKIKGLWNYFIKDVASDDEEEGWEKSLSCVLTSPPSAYELNAMLSTLGSRGKIRAAIKLYKQFAVETSEGRTVIIEADAYTASVLFGMLADSIVLTGDNESWSNNTTRSEIGESPCWQWNEAMELLDTFSSNQLNNVAYASLLKINEKATELYDKQAVKHTSVPSAMMVLDRMKQDGISPDVVTCSVIMSTFDKGRHWKAAVSLLDAMHEASSRSDLTNKWSLPPPNVFTYALAISTCARCDKSDAVLSLFDQMASSRAQDIEGGMTTPYTWVYNKALMACVESCHSSTSRSGRGIHLATAMSILEKMEDESMNKNSAPNVDSYNSVLAILGQRIMIDAKKTKPKSTHQSSRRLSKFDANSDLVFDILDEMKKRGIKWNAVTYSNAILACFSQPREIIRLFQMSVELERKADVLKVANSAFTAAANLGDIPLVSEVISFLSRAKVQINLESIRLIVLAFGKSGDCDSILALLICLRGQDFANDLLKDGHGIDILSNLPKKFIPVLDERIYSASITSSLKNDELAIADQILQSMKIKGISLNQRSLQDIIIEYCRMAMESSKEEYKAARIAKQNEPECKYPDLLEPIYFTSSARSKAALALVKAVNKPSFYLLSTVAKACAASGLWQESRSILRRMHRSAVRELKEGAGSANFNGKFLAELPKLHRYLLKFCAKSGHITPALNYADDIQYLAQQVRLHRKSFSNDETDSTSSLISISSILLSDTHKMERKQQSDLTRRNAPPILERPIGLTGLDWTLLLTAAWRGGHWKLCVGTLPYLSPYVKETHPKHSRELSKDDNDNGLRRPSLKTLDRKYSQLESAITAAVLCFEIRSQYAWAIRAIEDWMEWSGRRPPRQSVVAACRVLAKRYRGTEILNLVSKVISIQDVHNEEVPRDPSEYTYEKAIYTESINALYRSGLYDDADHLYAEGSRSGYLPSAVIESSDTSELTLDLHGMGSPVAHSAVRVSIQNEMAHIQSSNQSQGEKAWKKDIIIITGQGLRSEERLKPVLRPEVQRMLTEEFFPPIGSSTVQGNLGALRLQREDIAAWLNNQQQQKGERLLMIADALRGISSGARIERAIMSSGNRLEQALIRKMQSEKQND